MNSKKLWFYLESFSKLKDSYKKYLTFIPFLCYFYFIRKIRLPFPVFIVSNLQIRLKYFVARHLIQHFAHITYHRSQTCYSFEIFSIADPMTQIEGYSGCYGKAPRQETRHCDSFVIMFDFSYLYLFLWIELLSISGSF